MDYDCKEFCPNALRIYYLVKYIEGSTSNVHVSGFDISLFAYENRGLLDSQSYSVQLRKRCFSDILLPLELHIFYFFLLKLMLNNDNNII